ncbi:hypothetical protein GIB67_006809 [Kingdonia uniflora]|uniref:F-box associated beta-propeller type 1 domain-containing protein n=1 Tax=Kingdonia uniflora TaxID=39325 RepID=A0A7J7L001_9MAGN|nr:hypothetical protein GIB67_006809 [Kingdonia uniflora]
MMGIVSKKDLYGRSVCVSGSLYWVANANRNGIYDVNAPVMYILSFNLDSEEFGEIICPLIDLVLPGIGFWDDFYKLGVLGRFLSFTDYKSNKGYIDIWVLKDYDVNKVWSKQYIVGLSFPFELPLRGVRAICLRENGEILLLLYYGSLISYNPESKKSFILREAGNEDCYSRQGTIRAKKVILARKFYFNYITPDHTRHKMLRTKTPLPTEYWPFIRHILKARTEAITLVHYKVGKGYETNLWRELWYPLGVLSDKFTEDMKYYSVLGMNSPVANIIYNGRENPPENYVYKLAEIWDELANVEIDKEGDDQFYAYYWELWSYFERECGSAIVVYASRSIARSVVFHEMQSIKAGPEMVVKYKRNKVELNSVSLLAVRIINNEATLIGNVGK